MLFNLLKPTSLFLTMSAKLVSRLFSLLLLTVAVSETVSADLKTHENYQLLPKQCGINGDLITAFTTKNSPKNVYPWVVHLYATRKNKPDRKPSPACVGTLISKRYILTVAHCVTEATPLVYARLGQLSLDDGTGENVKIEKTIIHPDFNSMSLKSDIALIRLEKDVLPTENKNIRPICLPFDTKISTKQGSNFTQAAWGRLGHYDDELYPLLQVTHYRASGPCLLCPEDTIAAITPLCPISNTLQLCIEDPDKPSPCAGSSGSPLMVTSNEKTFVQAGMVSLSPGFCGKNGTPIVYTRVDAFLSWILDNIQP